MIKKIFITLFSALLAVPAFSQFAIQMNYDYGYKMYGSELDYRPELMARVTNHSTHKYGFSSYFLLDATLANNKMVGAYTELSIDKTIFNYPVSLHLEYNGGLETDKNGKKGQAYNDAYLFGLSFHDSDASNNNFTMQFMYKYLANHPEEKNSFQITAMWNYYLLTGLFSFNGYMDLWRDKSVEGDYVFLTEPELWLNMNHVIADFNLSIGAGAEMSYNFVDFNDGSKIPNNRFAICPYLAAKWTF